VYGSAVALLAALPARGDVPYVQHKDVPFADAYGVALVMDIFVPKEKPNGLGIIDVASGAWSSDRSKIRDHERAQMYNIFGSKGYTVFAIRPGSISKFSAPEMHAHLKQGIRWVKEHAADYKIDPNRLGLTGASAGGHLACLAAVDPDEAKDGKPDTRVYAVGVFFPPTDFTTGFATRVDGTRPSLLDRLALPRDPGDANGQDRKKLIERISPAKLVTDKAPPFLLIHGDADPLVPLQQSEVMVAALKEKNVPAELIVKKGGGHPWLTIHEEVKVMADWFDARLAASAGESPRPVGE